MISVFFENACFFFIIRLFSACFMFLHVNSRILHVSSVFRVFAGFNVPVSSMSMFSSSERIKE